jgi:hypothetical protein
MRFLALTLILLSASASAARTAPFVVRETGDGFASLQDAVDAIGSGSGTIEIAPGTYKDCAVQVAGQVAFLAQVPGKAIFNGGTCEDKATLVLRGRDSHVEGLTFTHTFVADGNGAGIRMEKGNLTVVGTTFIDAQSGILSANDPASTISIDHSTFSGLGKHPDGNGAHSLYVNNYGGLRVTNSRFERGNGGHYLKSRAPRIEVLGCSFDDSRGHASNYMIDLSNGAVGRIAGNSFVSGLDKENYGTMITVAPEGSNQPSAGLVIENNKAWLVPGFRWETAFVGSWTGEPVIMRNNALAVGIKAFQRH